MRNSRRLAFVLAAGGGALLIALSFVAWFHRTTVDRGTGEFAEFPVDLSIWDAREGLAIAIAVIAGAVVVLSILRVAPWLVGASGLVLIGLMVWGAVSLLGSHSPACCPTIDTDTEALLPFGFAAMAAILVAVGGLWAAESDRA